MSGAEVFHEYTGKNISRLNNGKRARRKDPQMLDSAVVYSSQSLTTDDRFDVSLYDAKGRTHLHIGVTIDDPGRENIQWTNWQVADDVNWVLLEDSNSWVREEHLGWCGRVVTATGMPIEVDKGDSVGVVRNSRDEVHFFHNEEDLGPSFLVGPQMRVWAVIEMETDAKEITAGSNNMRESAELQTAGEASGDQELFDDSDGQLGACSQEIITSQAIPGGQSGAVASESICTSGFHKRAGKNIILANEYKRAKRRGIRDMGQAIVFSADTLQDGVLFLARVKRKNTDETYVNLGVTPINPALMEDSSIPERLFKMRCDSCVLNMNNLFYDGSFLRPYGGDTHATVTDGQTVGILKTSYGDIHFYMNGVDLGRALINRDGPFWGIMEIMDDDVSLEAVSSDTYVPIAPPTPAAEGGQASEQGMSSDDEEEFVDTAPNVEVSIPAVLTPPPTPESATSATPPVSPVARPVPVCQYQLICKRFKDELNLSEDFFNTQYNMCFCEPCHNNRGDNLYYDRGEPPKTYGVPIGWCKFGLHMPPRAASLDVFKKWHMAFHGTKAYLFNSIFGTGDLLMPGDVTLEGIEIRPPPNHFNEKTAPKDFDIRRVFLSPSIKYAGCDVYAPKQKWRDRENRTDYDVRVALQVRISPDAYKVGPETIGLKDRQMDKKFSNKELEWFTNRRGAVILSGILVKIENWTPTSSPKRPAMASPTVNTQIGGFDS